MSRNAIAATTSCRSAPAIERVLLSGASLGHGRKTAGRVEHGALLAHPSGRQPPILRKPMLTERPYTTPRFTDA
jgi:hypothetical protein